MDSLRRQIRTVPSRPKIFREELNVSMPSKIPIPGGTGRPAGIPPASPIANQRGRVPGFGRRVSAQGFRRKVVMLMGALLCILLFLYGYVARKREQTILQSGNAGYAEMLLAADAFKGKHFSEAEMHFHQAEQSFAIGHEALRIFPGWAVDGIRFIPGLSKAASGRNVLLAGEHMAAAGTALTGLAREMTAGSEHFQTGSLLEKLEAAQAPLARAGEELALAKESLDKVNVADIPEERREKFVKVKELLPIASGALSAFQEREKIFAELLGGNGPRKYLFLFQNNHELRATGGFIGSYALLNLHDGIIEQFFVDGIFNPDGQLKENIVPPKPIQKISAGWSLHDSNWYPDFPTSAEKAIFFYEKTGGPTVDGVVTVTPTVMQRLLDVLGPIDLPQYGVTIDASNFIPIVQEQVEEKYDKEENNPKKILSDLTVEIFARISGLKDTETLSRVAEALVRGLNEKQILLYARHQETEFLIEQAGWSGKLLSADKDFLSVVHSNINGYKTDGVIDEKINHRAQIAADGSIVDTLSITRKHNGGNTPYAWLNKVNADYLRVYVPKGSELISVKGTTWEFPEAPLDYDALGFRRDKQVEEEESSSHIFEGSGTRVSQENDKTVFGSWVYVSPGESVTVELSYRLPFRIDMDRLRSGQADNFSILYQKQSGSLGSSLQSEIDFPERWKSIWQTGGNLVPYGRRVTFSGDLATDHFIGVTLMKEE